MTVDRILADVQALSDRAVMSQQREVAACAELQRILDALPYADAKSGKTVKLRRRLKRFLGDRLDGI